MKSLVLVCRLVACLSFLFATPPFAYAKSTTGNDDEVARKEAYLKTVTNYRNTLKFKSKGHDLRAMIAYAALLEQGDETASPDREAALDLYERAAQGGQPYARARLCRAYLLGDGRPKNAAMAAPYCNALDDKDPVSLFWVAYDYQYGVSGPADMSTALLAYKRAAGAGSGDAAATLGDLSHAGHDDTTARQWYRQGVYLGSLHALEQLAVMTEAGSGGPADPIEAKWLYQKAAERGSVLASDALEHISTIDAPPLNLWDNIRKTSIIVTHVYTDQTGTHTEVLDKTKIINTLVSYFPSGLTDFDAHAKAFINCFVAKDHILDVCIVVQETPPDSHLGLLVETLFNGQSTVSSLDSAGKPTEDTLLKFGVDWSH